MQKKADAPNVKMRSELQKTVSITIAELKAAQEDTNGLTAQEILEIKKAQMKECNCTISVDQRRHGSNGGLRTTVGASKFNPETNTIVYDVYKR